MDEQQALDKAIELEFAWRMNTYGMVRWGLSVFKAGWSAATSGATNPYKYWSMKSDIWERGKAAYQRYTSEGEL